MQIFSHRLQNAIFMIQRACPEPVSPNQGCGCSYGTRLVIKSLNSRAFQFSVLNQGSEEKISYKENIVTNYFQNLQLGQQAARCITLSYSLNHRKKYPFLHSQNFSLLITFPAFLQKASNCHIRHCPPNTRESGTICHITQSCVSRTAEEITDQHKVPMNGRARGMLVKTEKLLQFFLIQGGANR